MVRFGLVRLCYVRLEMVKLDLVCLNSSFKKMTRKIPMGDEK